MPLGAIGNGVMGKRMENHRLRLQILLKHNIFLFHHFADIDQGVAHAAQSSIDAHPGQLGDFLEAHIGVVAQDDDLSLFGRKHVYQCPDLVVGLAADDALFGVVIRHLKHVEDVESFRRRYLGPALGAAEIVYAHVVGNTKRPLQEFALVVVFPLAQGIYDLDENFLENIFSQALVFDEKIDGGINLLLMAVQQFLEGAFITLQIAANKLLVIKRRNLHN